MIRYFKHKSGDLIFAADENHGRWLTRDGISDSMFTARDGESFVVNRIYEEIKELPEWARLSEEKEAQCTPR